MTYQLTVLNEKRFNFINPEQYLNIHDKSVILLVFNDDKFNTFNPEHPENIPVILIMLSVLNEDKFISCNLEYPENIDEILVNKLCATIYIVYDSFWKVLKSALKLAQKWQKFSR